MENGGYSGKIWNKNNISEDNFRFFLDSINLRRNVIYLLSDLFKLFQSERKSLEGLANKILDGPDRYVKYCKHSTNSQLKLFSLVPNNNMFLGHKLLSKLLCVKQLWSVV
jgi:hypothetical protein